MRLPDLEIFTAAVRRYGKWAGLVIPALLLAAWAQFGALAAAPPEAAILLPPTAVAPPSAVATGLPRFQPAENWQRGRVFTSTPAPSTPVPSVRAAAATPAPSETRTRRPVLVPTVMMAPRPTPLYVFHRIKAGENIIGIAAAYGISSEALLVANEVRDPTRLTAGQYLLIPPHRKLAQPVRPYRVTAGDTLLGIALACGSSAKAIEAANPQLDFDKPLPPGEVLAVPLVFFQAAGSIAGGDTYYTVAEGDFPLQIARQLGLPVELLLATNNITDPTRLKVGQRLLVPKAEDITQGAPIILYDFKKGDTLLGLASRFGSSIKDILAANPKLDPAHLQAGQTLAIPVVFAPPRPTPVPGAPRQTPTPVAPPPGLPVLQQQMAAAVNAERAKAGLPPYEVDPKLAAVALAHVQDMVVRDYFGHVTPDGLTLRDRFAEGDIKALGVGEDIQRNTRPAEETVAVALAWFMGSPPHRANILHPHHNRIGIGIVESPPGWFTLVLDFAQR